MLLHYILTMLNSGQNAFHFTVQIQDSLCPSAVTVVV